MKNYQLVWLPKSVSDLGEHVTFLKNVSEEAAKTMSMAIVEKARSLVLLPERFPEFPMPSYFPWRVHKCVVQGRYILLFGIYEETVKIYRMLDARKNFDGLLG